METKRYLLFCFDKYDNAGGLNELHFMSNNLDDCVEYLHKTSMYYYQCLDILEFKTIKLDNVPVIECEIQLFRQVEIK